MNGPEIMPAGHTLFWVVGYLTDHSNPTRNAESKVKGFTKIGIGLTLQIRV